MTPLLAEVMDGSVVALVVGVVVVLLVVLLGLLLRARSSSGPQPDSGLRVDLILNPTKLSESGRADVVRALERAGADDVRVVETTEDDPGVGQARASAAGGADVVVACGGDGTVMACVTALAGGDVPLAIIPQGTGNLLARNLGIPLQVSRAARVAVRGNRQRIDVGAVGEERFAVMAGMGFDAAMLRDAPEKAKARVGALAYLGAAARNLREPGFLCTVTVDDLPPIRRRARTVLVGNVGRLQGGLPLLPGAAADDGLLDVAVISPRTFGETVAFLWRFFLRSARSGHMETLIGRRVEVRSVEPQPVQLDGDLRPDTDHLLIEVQAGALWLCLPGPLVLDAEDGAADDAEDVDVDVEDGDADDQVSAPG